MITANVFFKSSWDTYRKLVIQSGLLKNGIREVGYSDDIPLQAYVNHGRWLIKCECGGCEKAWEEGWFICQSCFNAGHKHQYRKAVFPKNRRQIESLLLLRPLPNRNWYPDETVKQLADENKEHKEELL